MAQGRGPQFATARGLPSARQCPVAPLFHRTSMQFGRGSRQLARRGKQSCGRQRGAACAFERPRAPARGHLRQRGPASTATPTDSGAEASRIACASEGPQLVCLAADAEGSKSWRMFLKRLILCSKLREIDAARSRLRHTQAETDLSSLFSQVKKTRRAPLH